MWLGRCFWQSYGFDCNEAYLDDRYSEALGMLVPGSGKNFKQFDVDAMIKLSVTMVLQVLECRAMLSILTRRKCIETKEDCGKGAVNI